MEDLFAQPGQEFERAILRLWSQGWNTARIANELGAREAEVANALPAILAARRRARAEAARKLLDRTERRLGVGPAPA